MEPMLRYGLIATWVAKTEYQMKCPLILTDNVLILRGQDNDEL